MRITEELPTDFGSDHNEENPHILRVGWSINSSSFQLGMYHNKHTNEQEYRLTAKGRSAFHAGVSFIKT